MTLTILIHFWSVKLLFHLLNKAFLLCEIGPMMSVKNWAICQKLGIVFYSLLKVQCFRCKQSFKIIQNYSHNCSNSFLRWRFTKVDYCLDYKHCMRETIYLIGYNTTFFSHMVSYANKSSYSHSDKCSQFTKKGLLI